MTENNKYTWKAFLNRYFIKGLNGMALGLFCSLIVGLIIKQIGGAIGGYIFGEKAAKAGVDCADGFFNGR